MLTFDLRLQQSLASPTVSSPNWRNWVLNTGSLFGKFSARQLLVQRSPLTVGRHCSPFRTRRVARDPRFERLPCSHKGTYADDCIVNRVTQHRCYIVATCDRQLRRRLRKVPGVPVSWSSAHVLHQ